MIGRGSQRAAYRQGLVLGLTMAEIMLLIVFTLLLVSGAMLQYSRSQLREMENAIHTSMLPASEIKVLSDIRQSLKSVGLDNLPDNWRELVLTSKALKSAGVQKLPENWQELVKLEGTLAEIKATQAEAIASVEAVREMKETARQLNVEVSDNNELVELVKSSIQASGPASNQNGHQWPPIIRLSEADGYSFSLGAAEISNEFRERLLKEAVPKLVNIARDYQVDIIEVIGHTDEVPIHGLISNLDEHLLPALAGNEPVSGLIPSDNAGLSMSRAAAVARILMLEPKLQNYRILPLSGAQAIATDERLSSGVQVPDIPSRRRIEIRVRRSSPSL